MKKFCLIIIALVAALAITACAERRGAPPAGGAMRVVLGVGEGDGDSSEYVDTDEPVYSPTPVPTMTPTPEPTPTTAPTPTGGATGDPDATPEVTAAPGPKGSYSADDCAVVVNGVTIRPNMDFTGKENTVGKVVEKLEGVSCMDSGYDINYYYDGFNIDTISQNGKQLVYMASFSGGGAKTTQGIGIGSTADDVLAAYGEPADDSGVTLAYADGTVQLMVYLEDDEVCEIVIVDTSFQ